MSGEVASTPGLELLVRLVAGDIGAGQCPRCLGSLTNSRISLVEHDEQTVVIKVTCLACGEAVSVRVEPETEAGTATVR